MLRPPTSHEGFSGAVVDQRPWTDTAAAMTADNRPIDCPTVPLAILAILAILADSSIVTLKTNPSPEPVTGFFPRSVQSKKPIEPLCRPELQ